MNKVYSIRDYIELIEDLSNKKRHYLFRGQRAKDKLLPKFLRNYAGKRIPSTLQIDEEKMFKDFKRRGRPFLKIEPQNEYEWLALAQHYGMSTRLLDWTSAALFALWFVVTSKRKDEGDGVIWVLSFDEEETQWIPSRDKRLPYGIKYKTKIFFPTHIENRFTAQGGVFTIHYYEKGAVPVPLNQETGFKNRMWRVVVDEKSFTNIRNSLNLCGINKLSLFPDFGGLCEHLNWKHIERI